MSWRTTPKHARNTPAARLQQAHAAHRVASPSRRSKRTPDAVGASRCGAVAMRSSDEGIRLIFRSENNVSVLPALRFTPRRTTMLCAERAFSCAVPSPSQRSAPIFIPVPCASTCRGRRKGRRHARRFAVTADRVGASAASNTTTPSSSGWHKLNTLWEADEESAMRGELLDLLSPAWRIMLLSDGSVTRHLRLLCPKLQCTQLECVRQGPIGDFASAGGARAMLQH